MHPTIVTQEANQAFQQLAWASERRVSRRPATATSGITNSKKSPTTQVPCYAFVQGRVRISPQLVSFGVIRPGESSSRDITLSRTGDAAFSVDRVKATTDAITTEILPDREGEVYRLRVTYNSTDRTNKTRRRVSERLTIFVGGEEEEVLDVPVYGTIHEVPTKKKP